MFWCFLYGITGGVSAMKLYGRHDAQKSISSQSTRKRPSRCGAPETVDPKSTSSSGGINQISVVLILSHLAYYAQDFVLQVTGCTCTVVQACCKGDNQSQWEALNFEPRPRPHPWTDCRQNRQAWLLHGRQPRHVKDMTLRFSTVTRWQCAEYLMSYVQKVANVVFTRFSKLLRFLH